MKATSNPVPLLARLLALALFVTSAAAVHGQQVIIEFTTETKNGKECVKDITSVRPDPLPIENTATYDEWFQAKDNEYPQVEFILRNKDQSKDETDYTWSIEGKDRVQIPFFKTFNLKESSPIKQKPRKLRYSLSGKGEHPWWYLIRASTAALPVDHPCKGQDEVLDPQVVFNGGSGGKGVLCAGFLAAGILVGLGLAWFFFRQR